MPVLELISILLIGFSMVSACILFVCYVFFLPGLQKTWFSIITCALLLSGLSCLQLFHLLGFINGIEPMGQSWYQFCLFSIPPVFYLFSRAVLLPQAPLHPFLLTHLLPILVLPWLTTGISIPLTFLIGSG